AGQVTGQVGNPMPLVFPVLGACINRGADPWSAFDAPVGLLAPCKTLAPLSQRRDGGVPRRPGGLPHNFRSIADSGKTSGIGLPSCPTTEHFFAVGALTCSSSLQLGLASTTREAVSCQLAV